MKAIKYRTARAEDVWGAISDKFRRLRSVRWLGS